MDQVQQETTNWAVYNAGSGTPTYSHNCINSDFAYYPSSYSDGDITSNAGYIDDDQIYVKYHLKPNSPCIDAGDNTISNLYDILTDIDGQNRIIDGNGDSSAIVDIGADESDSYDWYSISVTSDKDRFTVGDPIELTATVLNSQSQSVSGATVVISVDAGRMTEMNGTALSYGTTSHSGTTDANGVVTADVTRDDVGRVVVTARVNRASSMPGLIQKTYNVFFYQDTADDWPMFMHDMSHQGGSWFYDTTSTTSLDQNWSVSIPTATTSRNMWRIDTENPGSAVYHPDDTWGRYIFPHPYIDSSPVYAKDIPNHTNGLVFIGAWDDENDEGDEDYGSTDGTKGYIRAFEPRGDNGTAVQAWIYDDYGMMGGVASTPCVADIDLGTSTEKRIFFGTADGPDGSGGRTDGYIFCLDAATGTERWRYQVESSGETNGSTETGTSVEPGRVLASPVVYDGRVYIGSESAVLYCLDAIDGDLIWQYQFTQDAIWPDRTGLSSVAIGVVYDQPVLFVGCDNGKLYCLTLDSQLVWECALSACVESSPTFYDGKVYIGTSCNNSTNYYSLDATSGRILWSAHLDAEIRATSAIFENCVYIGIDTGDRYYCLDYQTGSECFYYFSAKETGRIPESSLLGINFFVGSSALSSCGTAYVGNDNHALYPINLSTFMLPNELPGYTGGLFYDCDGIVCSSPALGYIEPESGSWERWVYVLNRGENSSGTLRAFKLELDN